MTGHPPVELMKDGDGIREHNMACSIDAPGSQVVQSTNDFVAAQDVDTDMAPVVKATSSDVIIRSIRPEPNMG